jgi:hypothetical protein
MARSLLPVAVGLVGCIWPLSPALACDPAVARAEASAAWQALRELRSQDFFDAADEISPCPGLDGAERAELLRLQGASAALQKDTERAVRLFSEARALDPAGRLPEREFPPTHPVTKLYRLSAPRVAVVTEPSPQTVVIAVSAPPLPAAPPPSPAPRRAPLVVGAALSSVAAGGLWLASTQMDSRAELAAAEGLGQDAADAYAEQERYRGRQLGLQVAAGGSAALAVGLVGATVSLSW